MKARDFIKPDENVIVIFTKGVHFDLNDDDKTGSTGEWDIDPNRSVDRVIIYLRNDDHTNTLYIANHAGVKPAEREGRYNIQLTHVQYIGTTSANWHEFADTQASPIRYLP